MSSAYKTHLHFAHANGFPAGSYQQIFKQLPGEFVVHALPKFAHSADFPVNANLALLVAELIDHLEAQVAKPVYAVGHSMGAILSFIAACQRPDLIKGVIMLDPPIASGFARVALQILKYSPLIDKFSPAGKAKVRCQSWPIGTDLSAYFKARALFKNFESACVDDYVQAVVEEKDNELRLSFDAQIEASIYRNIPHNLNRYYKTLSVPGLLVTGGNSEVCIPSFLSTFVKKTQITHQIIDNAGHMFPMEKPDEVAALITQQIREWEANTNTDKSLRL